MNRVSKIFFAVLLFFSTFALWGYNFAALERDAASMDYDDAAALLKDNPVTFEDAFTATLVFLSDEKYRFAEMTLERALFILDGNKNARNPILFEKNAEVTPSGNTGRDVISVFLGDVKNFEAKKKMLDSVVEHAPDFAPARVARAFCCYREGDFEASMEHASAVLKNDARLADPLSKARAHLMIASAKGELMKGSSRLKKFVTAFSIRRHLKKARELKPNNPRVLLGWGVYRMTAPPFMGGDLERAEELITRAVEQNPNMIDGLARLAQLYLAKGNREKYSYYIERAEEVDPDHALVKIVKKMAE